MFTGIVEEMGMIRQVGEGHLTIAAREVLADTRVSDSIAVNGVCLTVTAIGQGSFSVDVVPETLRRTALGTLKTGAPVNLERPLAANGRVGGHFVQGHVEGTARVVSVELDGEALMLWFECAPALRRYIVPKGFIAVDGVSLTVVECRDTGFSITLIPFTQQHTNLGTKRPGDSVNIETDIIGRYIEQLFPPRTRRRRRSAAEGGE